MPNTDIREVLWWGWIDDLLLLRLFELSRRRLRQESGVMFLVVRGETVELFAVQDVVLHKIVSQPVLPRSLIQEDRVYLKDRQKTQLERFFTEEARFAVLPEDSVNLRRIEHSPLQRNIADGRPLFSLPDQCFNQRIEGYLSPIIKVLAELKAAVRDVPFVIGSRPRFTRGGC